MEDRFQMRWPSHSGIYIHDRSSTAVMGMCQISTCTDPVKKMSSTLMLFCPVSVHIIFFICYIHTITGSGFVILRNNGHMRCARSHKQKSKCTILHRK